jgi:hypothetical protein
MMRVELKELDVREANIFCRQNVAHILVSHRHVSPTLSLPSLKQRGWTPTLSKQINIV